MVRKVAVPAFLLAHDAEVPARNMMKPIVFSRRHCIENLMLPFLSGEAIMEEPFWLVQ